MKEMLLVGRGGEGVVLASQILAETFARAGFWVQSFPEFTAERRGAPISAFLRWDEASPIHRRYKMRECDVLVVLSPLPPSPELIRAVRPGGFDPPEPRRRGFARPVPSRSPACRPRRSPSATASSRPRGGRWATWQCSAPACGCCSRRGSGSSSSPSPRASAPSRRRTSPRPERAMRGARGSTGSQAMRRPSRLPLSGRRRAARACSP